jgi:hypothetical protein
MILKYYIIQFDPITFDFIRIEKEYIREDSK